MRKFGALLIGFLLYTGPGQAAAPQGKLIQDDWDAAFLGGGKAGYFHTTVRETAGAGQKILHSNVELFLTVKRFHDTIQMRMETGADETEDGTVTAVFMTQYLGKKQQTRLNGTVEGDQLHVRVEGDYHIDKKIPWDDKVVGPYRQERLFAEHKVKPGDQFSYLGYEPNINTVITTHVHVKDAEEVEVLGVKKKLLRVEMVPDEIALPKGSLQLPTLTSWLDQDFNVARSQVEMAPLGKITLYRTSREIALKQGRPAEIVDMGYDQLIALNQSLPRGYDTADVVYRITIKGEKDPATTFAQDNRQDITKIDDQTIEVHVHNPTGPVDGESEDQPKSEYLKSCYFINSDDAEVKAHAREAVGTETDPGKKARRIERWVHSNMKNQNFTEAFATADHVARTLEGDCTEYAVLTAAMCRAAGIPSRAAVGLLYVDMRQGPVRGPVMGFHMWAEVWVAGRWIPIDATLGRGYVGATHLKIADNSWYGVQTLTPLLPVARVLGKIRIEVE